MAARTWRVDVPMILAGIVAYGALLGLSQLTPGTAGTTAAIAGTLLLVFMVWSGIGRLRGLPRGVPSFRRPAEHDDGEDVE